MMTLEQRAQAIADVCLTTWRGGKRRQRIYDLALEMLAETDAIARDEVAPAQTKETTYTLEDA